MFCFRDMTFCESDCINKECHRHKSWLNANKDNFPVCFGDMRKGCNWYVPEGGTIDVQPINTRETGV